MASETIVQTVVPIAVFLMMFALGTGLTLADFKKALTRPKALAIGLITQIFAVPALGLAFVSTQNLEMGIALGIVILALCPGGAMSNVLTRLAGGDVALSVSLTAVTNLLAGVTLPTFSVFVADRFLEADISGIDIRDLVQRIVLVVTVPVLLGTLLRHVAPRLMQRYEDAVFRVSLIVFLLVIGWALSESIGMLQTGLGALGWQLVVFVVLLFCLGFGAGWVFGLQPPQRITLALETGVQNSGLGLAAAMMFSAGASGFPLSAMPSVTYSAIVYALALPGIAWLSRR